MNQAHAFLILTSLASLAGCVSDPLANSINGYYFPETGNNSALFQVADPELLWQHLVDVVDDDFRIQNEQRVQQIGDAITEGRIDTVPLTGATIFEPWHGDSIGTDQRLESTLQSMRRTARVRVTPTADGYLVDVHVQKELEDLPAPERSTISIASIRNDQSLDRLANEELRGERTTGWIPAGRDIALEQRILAKLRARLSAPHPAGGW